MLAELKKLREGRGLTADRIGEASALLAALETTDPADARALIKRNVQHLGDGERVRALKVDFGVDLPALLERAPSPRELDYLGERRQSYGTVIGRDVKTLARWSDKALDELVSVLGRSVFEGKVLVTAGVQNRRLAGIDVLRYDASDQLLSSGRTQAYTNPEEGPSPPLVLFGLPADWRATSLHLIVTFIDETPRRAWALASDNLFEISVGHQRFPIDITEGVTRCRIDNPTNDQVYGVWWEW